MDETTLKPIRGAQYVRMSTEHQQYSTQNQSDKLLEYAVTRDIEIVRTYSDEGRSGLTLGGRSGLQQLIADVESGNADFSVILVYDVSRWGRFQDADESAYWEYRLKQMDIRVIYVAEQFENDGSPVSTIVKGVKRAMAGEYSRELSAKVFSGQCRLIDLGYRQGGVAGFGLRRLLIDQHGNFKAVLQSGERKSLQTDRVVLVPGPEHEVRLVNEMYRWLIDEDMGVTAIAHRLNSQGIRSPHGAPWRFSTVNKVLTDEKYIGNNIFNRSSYKLSKKRIDNPPEMWVRRDGAFESIVPPEVFYEAQLKLAKRSAGHTDAELIQRLRLLYEHHGKLSSVIINEAPDVPGSAAIARRFGGMHRVYEQVGYKPDKSLEHIDTSRNLRDLYPAVLAQAQDAITASGGSIRQQGKSNVLILNDELAIKLLLVRCHSQDNERKRWVIKLSPAKVEADLTLVVRLDESNTTPLDYYLLPHLVFRLSRVLVTDKNEANYESFRFETLDLLYSFARRTSIRELVNVPKDSERRVSSC